MLITRPPDDPGELTEEETRRLQAARHVPRHRLGLQRDPGDPAADPGLRPDDSPAGQLAWITEKFGEWTDNGRPDEAVDRDQLLTNVTLYWLTGTAGSSARLYYETARARAWSPAARSTVPTGVAVFPREIAPPIRRFAGQSDTHRALDRVRPRRPLRGHGGARPAGRRRTRVLPAAALKLSGGRRG